MPVINKSGGGLPTGNGNPANRIKPISALVNNEISICIYGRPKTGKTRLAATFPKPLLILGTEDGTKSIGGVKDVDFVLLKKSTEVEELVDYAIGAKKYKSIVLDNVTQLQGMVLAEMLGLDEIPLQQHRSMIQNIDNQQYSLLTKTAINAVFKFNGNIIFAAHEKDFNEDSKTQSDLILPTIGTGLSKAVANWLNGKCDYICQTYIRDKVNKEEVSPGVFIDTPSGKGEYCLRIGAHAVYMTGFRVPIGAKLPDVIVNPTYQKIYDIITGKYKEAQ